MKSLEDSLKKNKMKIKYNWYDENVIKLNDELWDIRSDFNTITERFNHYIIQFAILKKKYKNISKCIFQFWIINFIFFWNEAYETTAEESIYLTGCIFLINKLNLNSECINDYMCNEIPGCNDGTTGFDVIVDVNESINVFNYYFNRFEVDNDDLGRILLRLKQRCEWQPWNVENLQNIIKELKKYFDNDDEIDIFETEF